MRPSNWEGTPFTPGSFLCFAGPVWTNGTLCKICKLWIEYDKRRWIEILNEHIKSENHRENFTLFQLGGGRL
jgi:hypothetical protein